MLVKWKVAKPVTENREAWVDITKLVDAKMDAAKWEDEAIVDAVMSTVQAELSGKGEEEY